MRAIVRARSNCTKLKQESFAPISFKYSLHKLNVNTIYPSSRVFQTEYKNSFQYLFKRFYSTQTQPPNENVDKKHMHDTNYFSPEYVMEAYQKLRDEFRSAPFVRDWKEVMEEMERRRYNTRRLQFIIGIIILIILWAFYDLITKWAGKQASVITTKTLEDPKFQSNLIKFGEDIANRLVQSPKIQDDVSYLIEVAVKEVIRREEVKEAMSTLLLNTLNSELIHSAGTKLTSDIANSLITSPTYEPLRESANNLIKEEVTKIAKDPTVHKHLSKLTMGTINTLWKRYI